MCLSLCQSLWLHCEHNLRCVCPCVNHCGCSVLPNGRCFSIAAIREGALWQQGMRRFEGCHGLQLIVCVLRSPSAGLSEVGLLWCGPVVQCDRFPIWEWPTVSKGFRAAVLLRSQKTLAHTSVAIWAQLPPAGSTQSSLPPGPNLGLLCRPLARLRRSLR